MKAIKNSKTCCVSTMASYCHIYLVNLDSHQQEAVRHQIHLEIEKMVFGWQENI